MYSNSNDTELCEQIGVLKTLCYATDSDFLLLSREGIIQEVINCGENNISFIPKMNIGKNISSVLPENLYENLKKQSSADGRGKSSCISRLNCGREAKVYKITISNFSETQDIIVIRDLSTDEKLNQAEKLAAIGRMSAYLTHEIKTPLASIKMNVDMLCRSLHIPEDKLKSAVIIQREIKRLDKLLKDMLHYSGRIELFVTDINLHSLIDNIKDFLEASLSEKCIEIQNNTGSLVLEGDYQKIKQVILCIVENSIDAIGRDGCIDISSSYSADNESVSVYVKDNGCGIEPAAMLFEPFYSTKNAASGLGLSIARKIMEQHGGELRMVSSAVGETIFEVVFKITDKLYG